LLSGLFYLGAGGGAGFVDYCAEWDGVGGCDDAAIFVFGGYCGWLVTLRGGDFYADFALLGLPLGQFSVRPVLSKLLTISAWLAFQSVKEYLMGPM